MFFETLFLHSFRLLVKGRDAAKTQRNLLIFRINFTPLSALNEIKSNKEGKTASFAAQVWNLFFKLLNSFH